jgi:ABC-type lipoprotein export system ATPase subunit
MLKMTGVSKIYRTDTVETHALRGFSLTVEEGEFASVTGPSGSGKTTFLNIAGHRNTIRLGAPNTHDHLFMPRCCLQVGLLQTSSTRTVS